MKRRVLAWLLPFFLWAQDRALQPIAVQRRLALVVGNGAYSDAPLRNAKPDADAMASSLSRLGFQVERATDVDLPALRKKVDEFSIGLRSGDLAFFYFAGHGLQINQENYLLPIGFEAVQEADVEYRAYSASQVRKKLEQSGARVRVMVLDACRNNPYRFARSAAVSGLAPMMSPAEGTIVAFAAADGQTAADEASYTQQLVRSMETPGADLKQIFASAQAEVYFRSNKKQNPAVYDTVIGRLVLRDGPTPAPREEAPALGVSAEIAYWNTIKDSKDVEDFRAYKKRYPNGQFTELAELRIDRYAPKPAAPAAPVEVSRPPATSTTPTPVAGVRSEVNPKDGLTYVWIPPGTFQMGCSSGDGECDPDEKPSRTVTLTKGYWLGQTEVTQAGFERVVGTNPSHFKGSDLPVETVDWKQAGEYCRLIGGRLPTEAEWERAAKAGRDEARYGGVGNIGWYSENSDKRTHAVAGKTPNAYGLYDMLGNVWELTGDWYEEKLRGGTDPQGAASGKYRVLRGGSWVSDSWVLRASNRLRVVPEYRSSDVGFRCVWER